MAGIDIPRITPPSSRPPKNIKAGVAVLKGDDHIGHRAIRDQLLGDYPLNEQEIDRFLSDWFGGKRGDVLQRLLSKNSAKRAEILSPDPPVDTDDTEVRTRDIGLQQVLGYMRFADDEDIKEIMSRNYVRLLNSMRGTKLNIARRLLGSMNDKELEVLMEAVGPKLVRILNVSQPVLSYSPTKTRGPDTKMVVNEDEKDEEDEDVRTLGRRRFMKGSSAISSNNKTTEKNGDVEMIDVAIENDEEQRKEREDTFSFTATQAELDQHRKTKKTPSPLPSLLGIPKKMQAKQPTSASATSSPVTPKDTPRAKNLVHFEKGGKLKAAPRSTGVSLIDESEDYELQRDIQRAIMESRKTYMYESRRSKAIGESSETKDAASQNKLKLETPRINGKLATIITASSRIFEDEDEDEDNEEITVVSHKYTPLPIRSPAEYFSSRGREKAHSLDSMNGDLEVDTAAEETLPDSDDGEIDLSMVKAGEPLQSSRKRKGSMLNPNPPTKKAVRKSLTREEEQTVTDSDKLIKVLMVKGTSNSKPTQCPSIFANVSPQRRQLRSTS